MIKLEAQQAEERLRVAELEGRRKAATLVAEEQAKADARANTIRVEAEAKSEAKRKIADAEAYAIEKMAAAEGNVQSNHAKQLATIRADSERLRALSDKTTIFLPSGGDLSNGLFRGLGKTMGEQVVTSGSGA